MVQSVARRVKPGWANGSRATTCRPRRLRRSGKRRGGGPVPGPPTSTCRPRLASRRVPGRNSRQAPRAIWCTRTPLQPCDERQGSQIPMLCDWLVVSHVLPANARRAGPGGRRTSSSRVRRRSSRRPKRGRFLDRIDSGTLAGLRHRALLSVMLYSFARVSSVLGMMRMQDYRLGRPGVAQAPGEGRPPA